MNDSNGHGVTDDITGDITRGLEHSGYIQSGLDRSTVGSITDLLLGRYMCDLHVISPVLDRSHHMMGRVLLPLGTLQGPAFGWVQQEQLANQIQSLPCLQ